MPQDENVMLIPRYVYIPIALYFNSVAAFFVIFASVKMSMGGSNLAHFTGPNISLTLSQLIRFLKQMPHTVCCFLLKLFQTYSKAVKDTLSKTLYRRAWCGLDWKNVNINFIFLFWSVTITITHLCFSTWYEAIPSLCKHNESSHCAPV